MSTTSEMPNPHLTIEDLADAAPTSLEHARQVIRHAVEDVGTALESVERDYYEKREGSSKAGEDARAVSKLMKEVNLTWLSEPVHMDRLAARCLYDDEKDLTADVAHVRRIYEKTWSFIPDRVQPLVESIRLIDKYLKLYCPAVYNKETDPHIQVSVDYDKLMKAWNTDIKKYTNHVSQIHARFLKGGLYLDEMSQSTRELAMKTESEDCPFVFAFYEACECLRECLRLQSDWLQYAGEYTQFLQGEMTELSKQKNDLQQKTLKTQDQYNKENYRLETIKAELYEKGNEQASIQSKEMELLVRDEMLNAHTGEMRLDYDIKEFRLAEMRRTVNPKACDPSILEVMSALSEEVRVDGALMTSMAKERNLIKAKMKKIYEKQAHYKDLKSRYEEMSETVSVTRRSFLECRRELTDLTHTTEQMRYMLQYLTTPDTAQMIFLNLPRRREALGLSKAHGLNLPSDPDDLLDTVFKVLSERLGGRWVQMYRKLPFYPPRGHRTVEQDIIQIQKECIRDSQNKEIRKSLDRWRRFHIRAKASDLLSVLKSLGEHEILHKIDRLVNPPRPPTPKPEVFPSFLDDKLIPYYQAISRYDNHRQSKKAAAVASR